MRRPCLLGLCLISLACFFSPTVAADGNRLAYLDENNPWYPHTDFPKLTTPQWVGEEGVEAVVVLAIDDMRDPAKYEAYLRPILQRLKQIDGRAPVSIMTCNVKPDDPQLQSWLAEGLSIEVHTVDHPCPLLQGGDFAKAKSTYDRCIDLLHQIPGNKPVAFRMPCCDSLNTVSPRFFSEIFNSTTPEGNHLSISSSVFTLFTSADKSIPRELVLNEDGSERFRRYLPKGLKRGGVEHNHFLNWIENYPYPYVINGKCWEFPCVVPSDWSAQFLQQPNNSKTVEDWKAVLDITVHKQGVFNLVFHPHGWIKAEQVVELIDHAVATHGKKVKFLTFREALNRLNRNLLAEHPLRNPDGRDNGVRVVDVDRDGFQDVVIGNAEHRVTRLWHHRDRSWHEVGFPTRIGSGVRFTQVREDGHISVLAPSLEGPTAKPIVVTENVPERAWYFDGREWVDDDYLQHLVTFSQTVRDMPVERNDKAVPVVHPPETRTWRFRDIDHDGRCEAIVTWRAVAKDGSLSAPKKSDVQLFQPLTPVVQVRPGSPQKKSAGPATWRQMSFPWPDGSDVPAAGIDPSLYRFVDLDGNGSDDLIASTQVGSFVALFEDLESGWSTRILNMDSSSPQSLLPIVREDGSDNGSFVHSGYLAWQNEWTADLPDMVQKVSIDELLGGHRRRQARLKLPPVPVGAAKIDITPDYPVRLSGYGNRLTESEGVAHRIHARALAIGGSETTPLTVLLTVDTCGVPTEVTERVFGKIAKTTPLRREHFAINSTHSHSAPWLMGFAPNIFAEVPDDHRARLQRYENELVEKLVSVVQQAIEKRRPGRLSISHGEVGFARNRRVLQNGQWKGFGVQEDGPVDHRLPVLAAHDTDGKLIAVLATYACHCTTETGSFNQISGDWAGFAAEEIESDFPGAVGLISIGAGADANPEPRGTHELSKQHGKELAHEVKRLLFESTELELIDPRIVGRMARVDLPLGPLPTREEWEQRAKEPGTRGSHARRFLAMLDRGEAVPTTVPDYPVQTWCFGDDLAMVFLGGEVVVDYSLRMNDAFDGERLWINAYSNDVPCYIASKRVLQEGGYEADFSMIYYARPTRLAPETEDIIVDTVQKLLPPEFYSEETQQDFPAPKSPEDSAACIQVKPGLKVELVAAEPLITDPVAFDWDIQGRLWVVEMGDYPGGEESRVESPESRARHAGTTGLSSLDSGLRKGRIRVLTDVDGDGRYDEATTFLADVAFPSGICRWRNGVIVTAAPEIFYAEDTDGDGRADVRTTLFRGFGEGNQQHRVNGLRWGLDGWLHVGNGDSGGSIESVGRVEGVRHEGRGPSQSSDLEPHASALGHAINVSGRDLRINPDTGEMEATSGQTQFGRARDDWGNWFGNNNSNPIWHYVLDEHDLRRNPHAPVSTTKAMIAVVPGAAPVFPVSRTLSRFNDFDKTNRFTSACSTTIYRDNLLGEEFYGDAFVCEPVHNLVSRLVLTPDGVTFKAERSPNERDSEFFASSDNWTRPVMVRTGPDGALWVADMYRFVIEHPKWIPAEQQRKLDVYAGSDRGRIYRIVRESNSACCGAAEDISSQPESSGPRSWLTEKWDEVAVEQLCDRLASPNGWWRDAAHRILLQRATDDSSRDFNAPADLPKIAGTNPLPQIRVQAMCAAVGLGVDVDFLKLLSDPSPMVRGQAVRLATPLAWPEGVVPSSDSGPQRQLQAAILQRVNDSEPTVQFQLAIALGNVATTLGYRLPAMTLGKLLINNADDPWITAAAISSLNESNVEDVLSTVLRELPSAHVGSDLTARVVAQAVAFGKVEAVRQHVVSLIPDDQATSGAIWGLAASIIRQIKGQDSGWKALTADAAFGERLDRAVATAIAVAVDRTQNDVQRFAAMQLAGDSGLLDADQIERLATVIAPQSSLELQSAAVAAIADSGSDGSVKTLLSRWKQSSPAIRTSIADALLGRRSWTELLLKAIEDGVVSPADLDAARRERLLTHRDAAIRERAGKLLGGSATTDRQAVVEANRSVLELPADATRGRVVFEKRCSACHKVGELGKSIGADLSALRDRSGEALLTAILDPNRAVEAKFLSYIAVTKDGRSFSGMLLSETGNNLTLIGTDGKEQTLLRSDLEELVATNRSLMPEGLEKDLAPQNLADVIAFVQSAGGTWKSLPGNQPRVVAAGDDGSLLLPADAAEIYGPSLILEQKYGNLGWWSSIDDYAVWTIETKSSGFYRVELEYACHDSTSGSPIRFSTGTRLLTARVPGTGTWDNYRTWSAGEIDLRRGRQQLTVSAPVKPAQALIDLKAIRLFPIEAR
ncbi:c-type cytochrome [bacterium]|nr:c-type cytochrome [bacterium]